MESAGNVDAGRSASEGRTMRLADDVHPATHRARATQLVRASWPMWLVAYSLSGFFVYLAVLDAIDVAPTTRTTGAYYTLLAVSLLAAAWHGRDVLSARARGAPRLAKLFLAGALAMAGWFLLNTALLSEGTLATRLAALLVLWSLPTALVAASLRRADLIQVAHGLVALGLALAAIEAVALVRAGTDVFRFTPIAELDPISAALIPALGAIAALALRPVTTRGRVFQVPAGVVLVAAAVVPGSRGPLLSLAAGALVLLLVQPPRLRVVSAGTLVAGLALGLFAGSHIGSFGYLTSADPSDRISTLSIRRQWLEDALRDTPDRPIFGHGVGMLVDDTPEAALMGVSGQRTYPHSTLVEAGYSLGAIGLIAYVAMVGSAAYALGSLVRRNPRDWAVAFALALGVFALVTSNISGEIGEDVLLWTASVVAVALHADAWLSRSAP